MTTPHKQSAGRNRRRAAGRRLLQVMLSPTATRALERLRQRQGGTLVALISNAVVAAEAGRQP